MSSTRRNVLKGLLGLTTAMDFLYLGNRAALFAAEAVKANMSDTNPPPPRKVVLFSGHMIDAPGREKPRFPDEKEDVAARAISTAMDDLGVNALDLAICGGACGGDLLFAEAALARNARLELYIPFEEATFLQKSVDFSGGTWRKRFFFAKSRASLHILPLEHKIAKNADPYEENNLWMLERAERFGADKVEFICLWNGQQGDGRGGTRHLMSEIQWKGGQIHWLDTTKLWK